MNINNIQANQFIQPLNYSSESDGSKTDLSQNGSPGRNAVVREIQQPDVQVQTAGGQINYLQDQLVKLLTSFPPFFPVGSPQRLDLIKTVNGMQEAMAKSSGQSSDTQKSPANQKLSEHATDGELGAALQGLIDAKSRAPQKTAAANTSTHLGTNINLIV